MDQPMSKFLATNLADGGQTYLYVPENLPALADVEELRWKVLVDSDDEKIGTIESIEVDEDTGRVEFIEVGRGGFLGFGAERFLVPVTRLIEVTEKTVKLDRSANQLEGVPVYEPDRLGDPEYCEGVRSWWCAPPSSIQPEEPNAA